MTADSRGWPLKFLRLDVRGNCRGNGRGIPRTSAVITAYRRIAVAMAADDCGWPWKLLRSGIRGNCRDNCRGLPRTFVVIGALPWQWLRMAMEIATAVSAETSVAIATDFHELP